MRNDGNFYLDGTNCNEMQCGLRSNRHSFGGNGDVVLIDGSSGDSIQGRKGSGMIGAVDFGSPFSAFKNLRQKAPKWLRV
jgi:hypothetical protein